MSCETSLITSIPIKRCPRNELEWNTRAALLNCSSINQTCVNPDKFEYHCVLNENVTGLVEVCAPSKHVFGNWLQQHMNISIAYFFSNVKEYKKNQLINLRTLTQFVEQKCLHFHTGGKLIQESVINCSSGPITCPKAYRSTEAYKCNPSFLIILMLYTFFDQTSRNQIFSVWRSIFITWAEIYI